MRLIDENVFQSLVQERDCLRLVNEQLKSVFQYPKITSGNARAMAYQAEGGCGISPDALRVWLLHVADGLDRYDKLCQR